MFACHPDMVMDLKRSLGAPESLVPLCKKIKNACLGSPKRKERFTGYGLIPVLLEIINHHPSFAQDALVIIGSLAQCPTTADQVLRASEDQQYLWRYVLSPQSPETAEAAAKVLRILVIRKPQAATNAINSDDQLLQLLKSNLDAISMLGARCIVACCSIPSAIGSKLALSPEATKCLQQNKCRSDDDALALSLLTWRRVSSDPTLSLSTSPQGQSERRKRTTDRSLTNVLSEFYVIALDVDPDLIPKGLAIPQPSDGTSIRTDGDVVLRWAMTAISQVEKNDIAITTKPSDAKWDQRQCVAVLKQVMRLMENHEKAIEPVRNEVAVALMVFCLSRPGRAVLAAQFTPMLVSSLAEDSNPRCALAALVSLTYYRGGSTVPASRSAFDRFAAVRLCLSTLLNNFEARRKLRTILGDESQDCFGAATRLIRQLSVCEESISQLIELDVHPSLVESASRNPDAIAALVNLVSLSETMVTFICGKEAFLRTLVSTVLQTNDSLTWAMLTNLAATRSIDNKRRLIGILPLARLVSEGGLPVLRNLCAGETEHAALIEPVIVPTITLIASGLEAGTSLEEPLGFLVNIASTTEANKATICNDPRVLTVISSALDSPIVQVRFAGLRCLMNLASSALEAGDDSHGANSPRSPMLRLVHARVMAAASRSPLRFGSMHSASSSSGGSLASLTSANARQARLVSFGFFQKLQQLAQDDEDEMVRELASEVGSVLSSS